jgi:glycosyltransferase involved in cell wall biosynthesis
MGIAIYMVKARWNYCRCLPESCGVLGLIKILFISPVGCIGGAERILLDCIREVQSKRPEWRIQAILFAEGPLLDLLVSMGVQTDLILLPAEVAAVGTQASTEHSTPTRGSNLISKLALLRQIPAFAHFLFQLRRRIRDLKPEIIHSNAIKSHVCLAMQWATSSKVLWHVHDYYSARRSIKGAIKLMSYRSSGCFAISRSVADDVKNLSPRIRVKLLENSVDVEKYSLGEGDVERLDQIAGLAYSSQTLRVGLIATYANWKGHDLFLSAIKSCANVRAYIVGGPIYTTVGSQWTEEELRKRAIELGIADRVGFLPFQKDLPWIYRSLDIVVHASTRPEPFGLTIAEAMSCGRPVVVSNAGGASELFTHMHDAIGHEPGNVDSLANAIRLLCNDSVLRQSLAINARKTAIEKFSPALFGNKLIAAYEAEVW